MTEIETNGMRGKNRAMEAGITFSLAILLFVAVSLLFSLIASAAGGENVGDADWYLYLTYLLPQLCFAAAAVVFFRRNRDVPPRTVYCGCKWYYFAVAALLAFGLFSLAELNGLFVDLLGGLGYQSAGAGELPTVTGAWILPALLVIALMPAIFEETLFRGILVGNLGRSGWGTVPLVLITGALFSFFHGSPEQTVYQFVCGGCYAFLAVKSGSPLPTMLAHFLNNAAILILTACGVGEIPSAAKLPLYLTAGVVLVGVLLFLILFKRKDLPRGGVREGKKFFLGASVGIAICAAEWIAVLLAGFVHV